MPSYLQTNETKSIFVSLLLHSLVILLFVFYFGNKPEVKKKPEIITMQLENIVMPTTLKPIEEVKPEPIEKEIIEPKKVETIQKPEPTKESFVAKKPIAEPKKTEPTKKEPIKSESKKSEEQPVVKAKEEPKKENYSKTNFSTIRGMVLANLVYPKMAKRMQWEGVVRVRMVIDSSGRLISASIADSSGKSVLDDAAMNAVMSLNSKTLPKPQETETITMPIKFNLED